MKKSNMAKKEDRFLEQNYEGDHLVHNQVKKIKQEESKHHVIDWSLRQPEMKMVLAREVVMTRQHSRSRLGLNSGQPIFVGDN